MFRKRVPTHTISALTILAILFATTFVWAQDLPQPRVPGNFDPIQGQAAPTTRPGRVMARSPRDDAGIWSPTDFAKADPALPSLVIAGDSTASTGDPNHRGWAAVLIDYFDTSKVNIINRAIGGRSFRSFYGEGSWQKCADGLRPGDYVVIEFGHNDGGGVANVGRGDLPGIGEETQPTTRRDGTQEIVHTFGWYLRTFVRDAKAKGAIPIVSSTTVRNIWHNPNATFRDSTILTKTDAYNPADDRVERGMGDMLEWARQVADQEKVAFLDHSNITADLYEKIGREAASKYHPADHTHTSTEGALVNAQTFIAGLKAIPDMPLVNDLNDKGQAIPAYVPPAIPIPSPTTAPSQPRSAD